MENASKALLMAGGILFAIIVISISAIAYSNITIMKQAELEKQMQGDIEKFNKPFLAFNKKAMYGTDVVSILNLAMSNNTIYNVVNNPDQDFYVNVSFKLMDTDPVQDRIHKFVLQDNGSYKKTNVTEILAGEHLLQDDETAVEFRTIVKKFDGGVEYNLKYNSNELKAFLVTAEQNEETKRIPPNYSTQKVPEVYYIKYSGMADFKRKTFKCSQVILNDEGRVIELKFEQIVESTYGTYQ